MRPSLRLTDGEKAMLDGAHGLARQKAMELLVRYGEALGAERFVDTNNVAGVPGSSTLFLENYYKQTAGDASYEAVFSLFDLDAGQVMEVPSAQTYCCHLQGGVDPVAWSEQGFSREAFEHQQKDEAAVAARGVQILKTCTPYLAGNVPVKGEHCAWMESSAVVFCNSALGARTNTEGRESTSAAMLTGKIPDWGLHRDDFRYGTHAVDVETPVESVMDWGMLGYFIGSAVEDNIPVITGQVGQADLARHKHFGAAAASSGGIELYHMVGITPEAATREMAFGPRKAVASVKYGLAERRATYERLNSTARDTHVDYVMLGCPHASLGQLSEAARLLDGRKLNSGSSLWVFTSRAVKTTADLNGYTKIIEAAGGRVMTDTCSAIGRILPPGTKVVALDSAKQAHYLPAMMGIEAWFGSTTDCIRAALTGRWEGELR
jgi:predicted aconitase